MRQSYYLSQCASALRIFPNPAPPSLRMSLTLESVLNRTEKKNKNKLEKPPEREGTLTYGMQGHMERMRCGQHALI